MITEKRNMFKSSFHTSEIIKYFDDLVAKEDGVTDEISRIMKQYQISKTLISPLEGKILEFLVSTICAKKAVEIGGSVGYSAYWMSRGLAQDGRLYMIEKNPEYVNIAKELIEKSNLTQKITIIEGDAMENLKKLSKLSPFDFCFINADTINYPDYLKWANINLKKGGIVVADKVFLKGKLNVESNNLEQNSAVRAMREFFHVLSDTRRFSPAVILPTGEL
jgi:predicted O-methyltransferase YrrM